jgi:hypothetical protein
MIAFEIFSFSWKKGTSPQTVSQITFTSKARYELCKNFPNELMSNLNN